MAKGNYYTPVGNGLWRDERTGAVGTLKVGRGGGFYVDADDQSGTSREKFKKEQISQAYRDADDKVANFYRRKNKEGQLKNSSKEEDVREAKKEANEKLAEAVEFGNLYNNPLQALPGEYDINEFSKIDENAKTRMGRFAERNIVAENLQTWGQVEYESDKVFIPDRNVIEDEWGNTFVTNDEYGKILNNEDYYGMGKRMFSPEEKVAGYQRRKGITQAVDDKAIESDIKSLFIYQNEKNMGAGPYEEPIQRYYDKYGKENVDRVWADMDKKYAVIQGTNMDYEGLRYNELVEKDKYSPEAIDFYRKQVENAWQNHSWDTKKYNEATAKAREEFERFDSERSSWEKEDTEIPTLDEEVRNLVKQNYGEIDMNDLYDEELDAITKVAQDNIKNKQLLANIGITGEKADKVLADREARTVTEESNPRKMVDYYLRKGEFSEADRVMYDYGLENEREEFLDGVSDKIVSDYNEYQRGKEDTSPMSEWSDTVGDGYSDAQRKEMTNYEVYEEGMKLAENASSFEERQKVNKLLDRIDRANRRGEGYSDKATNELRELLRKEAEKEQEEFEKGKEIYETYRHMSPREMDHFAKQNQDSIEKMKEYLTNETLKNNPELKQQYEGLKSKVERFKERKGSATKTDNGVKETYTKSGKINYKAFGIERTPENDFTDDGTRFSSYMLSNGMEMTVAKANDETYMSVRTPYDKEISYQEYSNLPHYKDLDMYNGVSGKVDLNKLVESANAYMNEYNELKKQKGLPVDERSVYQRRLDNMESAIKMANESYDYHYNYYKNHPGEYSGWRRHDNEARKAKNKAYKLAQKREKFISENEKIEAQVERYKKRKNK